ncbi:hypothetical protein [Streptomyces sp. NPDC089919]|uniref:RICIN domain-containing protein n=1 Tax=Streptomyces sp. NPDC089919 TaxID=3155188 RepID=UPI00343210C2
MKTHASRPALGTVAVLSIAVLIAAATPGYAADAPGIQNGTFSNPAIIGNKTVPNQTSLASWAALGTLRTSGDGINGNPIFEIHTDTKSGYLRQTITSVNVGDTILVKWRDRPANQGDDSHSNDYTVSASGSSTNYYSTAKRSTGLWTDRSYTFTATQANPTLSITSTDPDTVKNGAFIDDVTVSLVSAGQPTPPPTNNPPASGTQWPLLASEPFRLAGKSSGLCVDTAGAKVVQATCTPEDDPWAQEFSFRPTDGLYGKLVNRATGMAVSFVDGANGTAATQAPVDPKDENHQNATTNFTIEWQPTQYVDGWQLKNRATLKCLTIADTASGSQLTQTACSTPATASQLFQILPSSAISTSAGDPVVPSRPPASAPTMPPTPGKPAKDPVGNSSPCVPFSDGKLPSGCSDKDNRQQRIDNCLPSQAACVNKYGTDGTETKGDTDKVKGYVESVANKDHFASPAVAASRLCSIYGKFTEGYNEHQYEHDPKTTNCTSQLSTADGEGTIAVPNGKLSVLP